MMDSYSADNLADLSGVLMVVSLDSKMGEK
jgi:hypothetical protein